MERNTMKAFVIRQPGAQIVELSEVPVPAIEEDELLVRVHAVGVGIHDSYFLPRDAKYPYPIGIEAAGVIEQIGSKVSGRELGERIAFVSSMQPKGGTWAEFVAVKAGALIVQIPTGMEFIEAAAVPVAGNTVLRAFRALITMPPGGSLFVAGGSGAIGTLAIQIARQRGWRVAASASAANQDHILSLGAQIALDYRDPRWQERVLAWTPGGVDAAVAVQPGTSSDSLPVVKDYGALVTISGDELLPERDVQCQLVPHQMDVQDELVQLMVDISSGEIHVELEQVYEFGEALAALEKVATRHARGKVVLHLG
ncbi:NADP-dependent oxidoreductase [Arthrobacter sp. TMP15]|uniref:NADP-dependent oxidoreductase n=2 Tax=unclassified Arthrobacter TaxID=235627 RepID=UPI0031BA3DBE